MPPNARRMRNPYLLVVTKDVTSEMTPKPTKPAMNTIHAGKRSDSRPANKRREAKVSEYAVMIYRSACPGGTWTYPDDLGYLELYIHSDLGDGNTDSRNITSM